MKINRNKWEKCEVCGKADGAIMATYATEDMQGFTITNHNLYAKYCPECGRPLKEQAWKEFEERMFKNEN